MDINKWIEDEKNDFSNRFTIPKVADGVKIGFEKCAQLLLPELQECKERLNNLEDEWASDQTIIDGYKKSEELLQQQKDEWVATCLKRQQIIEEQAKELQQLRDKVWALEGVVKDQESEIEQQKEEIERLNGILEATKAVIKNDRKEIEQQKETIESFNRTVRKQDDCILKQATEIESLKQEKTEWVNTAIKRQEIIQELRDMIWELLRCEPHFIGNLLESDARFSIWGFHKIELK